MLKIRLQKIGKKNSPSFRIVLVEHTSSSKSGKYIELLGSYNPRLKQKNFKKERIDYWITKGVKVSPTVFNLLVDEKIIDKAKVKAWRAKPSVASASAEATADKKSADLSAEANKAQAEVPTNVGTKAESRKVKSPSVLTEVGTTEGKGSKVDTELKKE